MPAMRGEVRTVTFWASRRVGAALGVRTKETKLDATCIPNCARTAGNITLQWKGISMKAGDRLFWSKGGEEVAVVWLGSGNWVGVWVGGEVKVVDRNELSAMDDDLDGMSVAEQVVLKRW